MRQLKDKIPRSWRLRAQLAKRWAHALASGRSGTYAPRRHAPPEAWPRQLSEVQPVRPGAYFANKVHNIRLAASAVGQCVVAPGQVFSFWHIVGAPTQGKGYREGRNLVAGRLQADFGGGLCQLSGILYLLALRAGLEVLERHHHSVDIYAEEERFCPLGADATVVYGYKDLQFRNTLGQDIAFSFEVSEEGLAAHLLCLSPVGERALAFVRTAEGGRTLVRTVSGTQMLAVSVYQRLSQQVASMEP